MSAAVRPSGHPQVVDRGGANRRQAITGRGCHRLAQLRGCPARLEPRNATS
jgi:hypothetical protein